MDSQSFVSPNVRLPAIMHSASGQGMFSSITKVRLVMFAMFVACVKGVMTHREEVKTFQISLAGRTHQKSCMLVVC
jgi:hypothetical protein